MIEVLKVLHGIRVLCVDDHPDSLTLLSQVLSRYGAIVTSVSSAEEGVRRLEESTFDVVVSDLRMPDMDGYDLAHALRAMESDLEHQTPMVALSGDAARASVKRRFADFQVYISKPFDRHHLVHVVARLAEADGEAVSAGTLALWEADRSALNALANTTNNP